MILKGKEKQEIEKKTAGEKAAEFVKDGMIVGLGTGSTVYYAIKKLGEMVNDGLKIKAVSSSKATTKLAESLNIELININDTVKIDLTIDGADEVDHNLNGIKGGGGALLFEKITALLSSRNIWIADSSKLVNKLGKFPLPVEVIPFGSKRVFEILNSTGLNPVLRIRDGKNYLTDSGNYIFDLHTGGINDPEGLDKELKLINGVVETGLFTGIADIALVSENETVKILKRGK
ncbi:MAG: ribose-5-phosphate isomerase RpiA [Ignavibacteria bacterium]|nr:ribose-5-phosphate isomerase RpiA [Ignavibacteria bacterium]